jgi:hypothetical protein
MKARAAVWAENWAVVSCRWWVKVRGLVCGMGGWVEGCGALTHAPPGARCPNGSQHQ